MKTATGRVRHRDVRDNSAFSFRFLNQDATHAGVCLKSLNSEASCWGAAQKDRYFHSFRLPVLGIFTAILITGRANWSSAPKARPIPSLECRAGTCGAGTDKLCAEQGQTNYRASRRPGGAGDTFYLYMRYSRCLPDADAEEAYFHCVSRVVDRRFALDVPEKEKFVQLMRAYEEFSGVRLVTFGILSNHFHLLIRVPHRPSVLPTDDELVRLVKVADCRYGGAELAKDLKRLRESGDTAGAEALRERFFRRMWNVSAFLQSLKQRFTQWLNRRYSRTGTLWEGRFKSVLVEGLGAAIAAMAAYIDLNAVRAGIEKDPKDYRWCGYGQAVRGDPLAREGLRLAVQARLEVEAAALPAGKILALYRKHLFEKGAARKAGDDGCSARLGFTEAEVKKVIDADGRLPLHEALLCRVRYFCDSAVLGSKAFIENFFRTNPSRVGRRSGARPLRYIDLPNTFTLRELRSRVITKG